MSLGWGRQGIRTEFSSGKLRGIRENNVKNGAYEWRL